MITSFNSVRKPKLPQDYCYFQPFGPYKERIYSFGALCLEDSCYMRPLKQRFEGKSWKIQLIQYLSL